MAMGISGVWGDEFEEVGWTKQFTRRGRTVLIAPGQGTKRAGGGDAIPTKTASAA